MVSPGYSTLVKMAENLGFFVQTEVWGTKAWKADLLLHRGAACVNIEHEVGHCPPGALVERARRRLDSGCWVFWRVPLDLMYAQQAAWR
jgi:hypothetical protein